jgi:adenylate cyclase
MPEIERAFLVAAEPALGANRVERIEQGYLAIDPGNAEVRLRRRGTQLTLTVKSTQRGAVRAEEEIPLDAERFERLWPLTAGRRLEKDRHLIALSAALVAELDIYDGVLHGLRVVEVEFESVAAAAGFQPPEWFGREVTDDERYRNRSLAVDGRPHD